MRQPLVAGNWKMNLDSKSSVELARQLTEALPNPSIDVAVCPPSVYLTMVGQTLTGSSIGLGAQNVYPEAKGAFTGEISPAMLSDVGCRYVIVGHSERRGLLNESDADVNKKMNAVFEAGMIPIVCLGETLKQREADKTIDVIQTQFRGSIGDLDKQHAEQLVLAYEPVWAIGTGKTATPEQAEEVHAALRSMLTDSFGQQVAAAIRIQYGGSVKPANAAKLMSQPNIDGALVGGASLEAPLFVPIVEAAEQSKS